VTLDDVRSDDGKEDSQRGAATEAGFLFDAFDVNDSPSGDEDNVEGVRRRKRKRQDADEEIEDAYMRRLGLEEQKERERALANRTGKRQKASTGEILQEDLGTVQPQSGSGSEESPPRQESRIYDAGLDEMSPPPKHETQEAADSELVKANRTVFLGNVSTTAISSKTARKTLIHHLSSFFKHVLEEQKPKVESIRFRSTPYASAIPKKAAYARRDLMDATTKSTNAYVVYSSPLLAREATKRLNGSMVLERHLRVDEVSHPSPTDHKRCVFVGSLGFVNDESNIQDADQEDGREKRKKAKQPADIEEGLWRVFGKCGTVESVRVIRDSTTRVGKGVAYVQFKDANAVEAALLFDGKKFPPLLPRKLRVERAKPQRKNGKPGSGRPGISKPRMIGYQRKVTGEEASRLGRAEKLLGRAAAAQMKHSKSLQLRPNELRKPESYVFEGHRASSTSGKAGLKLGRKSKGKPSTRSARRGASYKAAKGKGKVK